MGEWDLGTGLVWVLAALWAVTLLPAPIDARPARPWGFDPVAGADDTPPSARRAVGGRAGFAPAPRAAPPGRPAAEPCFAPIRADGPPKGVAPCQTRSSSAGSP